MPLFVVSNAANRINRILAVDRPFPPEEIRVLVNEVIKVMEGRSSELTADDCSRLAWLYLNIHDQHNAMRVAQKGLAIDEDNTHCLGVVDRLQPHES